MGRGKNETSSSGAQDVTVYLNVYDLSEQNDILYWCGFGVFHTGVEVFGFEYAYGGPVLYPGHDFDASGIFATEPKNPPGPVEFRKSIPMGTCRMTNREVKKLVIEMGKDYRGNAYHLLQKNCNHFANDLCQKLVGKSAPTWVPFLFQSLLPDAFLMRRSTVWLASLFCVIAYYLSLGCHPSTHLVHHKKEVGNADLCGICDDDVWIPDVQRVEHQTLLNAPRSDAYPEAEATTSDDSFASDLQRESSFESERHIVING